MTATATATAPAATESNAVHPFYAAGMGPGPYRFQYCYDMGEAMDPTSAANFGNLRGWVADAPKLEAGLGTCACCGMAIMLICVIKTGEGKLYGVGSDCVEKCDHAGAFQGAKAALALRTREKNRARRAAKAAAKWEAERPAREAAQREESKKWLEAYKARHLAAAANHDIINAFFPGYREDMDNGVAFPRDGWLAGLRFFSDRWENVDLLAGRWEREVLAGWMNGEDPRQMAPRGKSIICEIAAKRVGRSGSKAYEERYENLRALLGY